MTNSAPLGSSSNDGVQLADVVSIVPAFLRGLPAESCNTLLNLGSAFRYAVHRHATVLRIPACDPCGEDPDIQLLVRGAWSELQRLELYSTNLDAASVTQLRTGQ